MSRQYVEMTECEVRKPWDSAVLLRFDPDSGDADEEDMNTFWVPYSQIEDGCSTFKVGERIQELMITDWIVEQKEMDEYCA